jgi:hypothetical protein
MNTRQADWCAICKALALRSDPMTADEEADHEQKVAERRAKDEGPPDLFNGDRGGA